MGRLQRSPFGKGKEVERNGMHMKEWLRGNTDSYRFFSKAHFFVLPKLEWIGENGMKFTVGLGEEFVKYAKIYKLNPIIKNLIN